MIAAAVQFGACIYSWFFGGFDFNVGPLRVRIHEWVRPWYTGMGFLLIATFIRPRPFLVRTLAPFAFMKRPAGKGPNPWSWAWFGAAAGFGIGLYLGHIYAYVFSFFVLKLVVAVMAALLFGALHYLWGRLFLLISRLLDPAYVRGVASGLYVLLWACLVLGPLGLWEGRFVDPFWPFIAGLIVFMFFTLIAGVVSSRLPGSSLKAGVVASVVLLAALVSVTFIIEYRSLHPEEVPRDRILLITLDTTRADHLSCYGHHRRTSPFIDSLAESGVLFERAIAPIGRTDPSHASMLTGAYPRTHGCWKAGLPITGDVASLAEYFQQKGYSTAAILSRAELGPTGALHLPGFDQESVPSRGSWQTSAPLAFRRATAWLCRHRNENVFMWVHFFDPHKPYVPHPELDRRFSELKEPRSPKKWLEQGENIDDKTVRESQNLYDEEIAYVDLWVKKLVNWTKELEPGTSREPLLILIADHGEALGESKSQRRRFGFGHVSVIYNSVLHIPFIINWQGEIEAGTIVKELAETTDLAPTMVELVFGKKDFPAQGKNLAPLIKREGRTKENRGVAQRYKSNEFSDRPWLTQNAYAVYKGAFKLLVRPREKYELYNMDTDLNEHNELSSKYPGKVKDLLKELDRWKKRTPKTEPAKKEYDKQERHIFKALGYIQ